ncbi:hypothetical protein [Actinacidiphila soli]|uniref:hypothetical protein n=1 Tax=Actinacidiphila soli TaxID=2487275 RepID=UPI000FCA2A90|nr:hypothetical protein [Actinacidiphila soli]
MTATYRSDHAADPELYERLMRERYGPLPKVMAERDVPPPPDLVRSHLMPPRPAPDPDAATHYADLQEAINEAAIGRPGSLLTKPKRIPPFPGAAWCNSCDTWCTPQGMCRCNDR